MSMINTNVKSLLAQQSSTINDRNLGTAMAQLSTGKRINSAKDDAAGLSITSKMTTQIRGLEQASRNAGDAISLLQTSEGAMVEITNMLQRMRELAVQSASDTYDTNDRKFLDDEFQALKGEINRIAKTTTWNGSTIMDQTSQTRNFQVGANSTTDNVMSISFKDFSFTPANAAVAATQDTIDLSAAVTTAGVTRFSGTIAGVNVTLTGLTSLALTSAGNESAGVTTLASELQTGIRKYAGLEGITVTSVGETLTIKDAQGRAITDNFKFVVDAGTTSGVTDNLGTGATASAGAGAAGAASVFGSANGAEIHSLNILQSFPTTTTITALDNAIKAVTTERSKYGAAINRLTYTIDNLSNEVLNTSAARGRILDTDYAKASSELARTQIIQQAATAMLAQANQSSQSVLALLK